MSKPRRIILSAVAALAFALVALPAAASANTIVQPALTFPERQAGSVSDPQTVTVTIVCNTYNAMTAQCTSLDTFFRNPQFFGDNPGDFSSEGGTCPAQLTLTNAPVVQCSILVRFKPTAPGERKATFLAGATNATGGPNLIPVSGSAVAAPVQPAKKCKKGKKKKKCKKKRKK